MSIASSVLPQYDMWDMRAFGGGFVRTPDYSGTAGKISNAYTNAAENTLNTMINAAKNAINANNANNAKVNSSIDSITNYAGQVAGSAEKMDSYISDLGNYANQITNVASSLTPYAQSLKDYASSVYGQGQTLVDQGNNLLGTWSQFSPLVGKYVSSLEALSPDRYVSAAASDVQKSFQNTQGQNQRAMARMGVDPSSGAYQAQKAQWDQALATALAGAKTRARRQGLTEQIAALQSGLGVGSNLAQAGAQIGSQGTNAMQQAGSLLSNAAGVLQGQGSLLNSAAGIVGTQGNLTSQQGGLYQSAGSLQGAAGSLALNLGTQQLQAQNLLNDAYASAAAYYGTQAANFADIAGKKGLLEGTVHYY